MQSLISDKTLMWAVEKLTAQPIWRPLLSYCPGQIQVDHKTCAPPELGTRGKKIITLSLHEEDTVKASSAIKERI